MDPATFVLSDHDNRSSAKAIVAVHVDDTITIGKAEAVAKIQEDMSKNLKYGTNQSLPCRYLGLDLSKDGSDIIVDQDHYVQGLEIPNISDIQALRKEDILPEHHQTTFRSVASKLNMLALTARPYFTFNSKLLTTKYGSATKKPFV